MPTAALTGVPQIEAISDRPFEWRNAPRQWDCYLTVRIGGQSQDVRVRPDDFGTYDTRFWTYSPMRDQARFLRQRVQAALARGEVIYAAVGEVAVPIRAADFGVTIKPPRALRMFERK